MDIINDMQAPTKKWNEQTKKPIPHHNRPEQEQYNQTTKEQAYPSKNKSTGILTEHDSSK